MCNFEKSTEKTPELQLLLSSEFSKDNPDLVMHVLQTAKQFKAGISSAFIRGIVKYHGENKTWGSYKGENLHQENLNLADIVNKQEATYKSVNPYVQEGLISITCGELGDNAKINRMHSITKEFSDLFTGVPKVDQDLLEFIEAYGYEDIFEECRDDLKKCLEKYKSIGKVYNQIVDILSHSEFIDFHTSEYIDLLMDPVLDSYADKGLFEEIISVLQKKEDVFLVHKVIRLLHNSKYFDMISCGDIKRFVQVGDAKRIFVLLAKALDDVTDCSRFTSNEQFLRWLGTGAAASTYLVYSKDFEKEMAMKVISKNKVDIHESINLGKLMHPNIVRIWYAGNNFVKKDGESVYAILMDFVDGSTINELIQQNPNGLTLSAVARYSCQLFEAIIYLRKNNIFHRDIHPGNVKINSHDDAIIIDFGISCSIGSKPKDNRRYGGTTDLFSLGLLIYKMATGKHLLFAREQKITTRYYANKIAEIKRILIVNGTLRNKFMKKIKRNMPQLLNDIVTWCLLATEENMKETLEKIFVSLEKAKKTSLNGQ